MLSGYSWTQGPRWGWRCLERLEDGYIHDRWWWHLLSVSSFLRQTTSWPSRHRSVNARGEWGTGGTGTPSSARCKPEVIAPKCEVQTGEEDKPPTPLSIAKHRQVGHWPSLCAPPDLSRPTPCSMRVSSPQPLVHHVSRLPSRHIQPAPTNTQAIASTCVHPSGSRLSVWHNVVYQLCGWVLMAVLVLTR